MSTILQKNDKMKDMKIPLKKVHALTTLLAITTIVLGAIILFVFILDEEAHWNILPPLLEMYVFVFGWFVGITAIASSAISILLSLYAHRTDA